MKYAYERLEDCWDEVVKNSREHWNETEGHRHDQSFNPDKERYLHFENMGIYYQFTVRDEGKLVGNCGMYVMKSMHTQELVATEDTWYLLPDYRKAGSGVRLYRYVEKFLENLGVVEITMSARIGNKSGQIMEKLGYNKTAYQYSKHLVQTAPIKQ